MSYLYPVHHPVGGIWPACHKVAGSQGRGLSRGRYRKDLVPAAPDAQRMGDQRLSSRTARLGHLDGGDEPLCLARFPLPQSDRYLSSADTMSYFYLPEGA